MLLRKSRSVGRPRRRLSRWIRPNRIAMAFPTCWCLPITKFRTLLKLQLIMFPLLLFVWLLIYLFTSTPGVLQRPLRPRPPIDPRYVAALHSRADTSGLVVLVMVDESFVDMAVNLYQFSFLARGIDNFLFVGIGDGACAALGNMSLPCFRYADDPGASKASRYGTVDFVRKTNLRNLMILDALEANFTVLQTDVDVAFITNPLQELKETIRTAHMAIMWDHLGYNAGFLVIRPTWMSRFVYETMWRLCETNPSSDDQSALNAAIRRLNDQRLSGGNPDHHFDTRTAFVSLDRRRFLCGVDYFEKPGLVPRGRNYTNHYGAEWNPTGICGSSAAATFAHRRRPTSRPCADVVHNNWIVGKAAKIYRFREHLLWAYDPGGTYYADTTARYLTYMTTASGDEMYARISHNLPFNTTWVNAPGLAEAQLRDLRTALALGHLLNRSVILPRFYCGYSPRQNPDCPLNALVDIEAFDVEFAGRYRESSFLHNRRVPAEIRFWRSAVRQCRAADAERIDSTSVAARQTGEDVRRKFGPLGDEPVVVFESFADELCYPLFDDHLAGAEFEARFQRAFVRNDYRQLERDGSRPYEL